MTEAKKKQNKRAYLRKISEHRCVNCGKQDERTLQGFIKCKACVARNKANASPRPKRTPEQQAKSTQDKRDWIQRCKDVQMCIRCGTKDKHTIAGHRLCLICAGKDNKRQRETRDKERVNESNKSRRDSWREHGLCTYCGGKKEEPDKAMCIDCRVRARMNYRARQRKATGNVERSRPKGT